MLTLLTVMIAFRRARRYAGGGNDAVTYEDDMSSDTFLKRMERHPLSAVFPEMEGQEYEALKASLKKDGLMEPIYLYEGKILDGWNRARAIWALHMRVPKELIAEFSEDEMAATAEDWSIAHNLHRRQLTAEQKVQYYDKYAGVKLSAVAVADMLGINEKTARRARQKAKEESQGKTSQKENKPDTIESLQKKLEAARNKVAEIEAKIAALQSISKPDIMSGSPAATRTLKRFQKR